MLLLRKLSFFQFSQKHSLDAYKVLNISQNASSIQIKKAFGVLAKKYHPDKNPAYSTKFQEIKDAYEILNNPDSKRKYDRASKRGPKFNSGAQDQTTQENPFFRQKSRTQEDFQQGFTNYDTNQSEKIHMDFENTFSGFKYKSKFRKGGDIKKTIKISFIEAVLGVKKSLLLERRVRCPRCRGSRCVEGTLPSKCWSCYGKGMTIEKVGPCIEENKCYKCDGSGF